MNSLGSRKLWLMLGTVSRAWQGLCSTKDALPVKPGVGLC